MATPFVFELKKLTRDFVTALGGKKLQRLQRRRIVLGKTVAPGRFPPDTEKVITNGALLGIKLPKSRKGFEHTGYRAAKAASCKRNRTA